MEGLLNLFRRKRKKESASEYLETPALMMFALDRMESELLEYGGRFPELWGDCRDIVLRMQSVGDALEKLSDKAGCSVRLDR